MSSFKRPKSTSKYYSSLELELFFLQHWVPPSALTVPDLHFLTVYCIEEVSLPRDSSSNLDMLTGPFYAWYQNKTLLSGTEEAQAEVQTEVTQEYVNI